MSLAWSPVPDPGVKLVQAQFRYLTSLESLTASCEDALKGDSIDQLGDCNVHVGSRSVTWRGVIRRNGLSALNMSF